MAPVTADAERASVTPEELVALRADMLRFARLQLRDAAAAADLVQDAIEAALNEAESFAGRSSVKTWVFSILRNRMVDHVRRSAHTVPLSSLVGEGDDWEERLDGLFSQQGAWTPGGASPGLAATRRVTARARVLARVRDLPGPPAA